MKIVDVELYNRSIMFGSMYVRRHPVKTTILADCAKNYKSIVPFLKRRDSIFKIIDIAILDNTLNIKKLFPAYIYKKVITAFKNLTVAVYLNIIAFDSAHT